MNFYLFAGVSIYFCLSQYVAGDYGVDDFIEYKVDWVKYGKPSSIFYFIDHCFQAIIRVYCTIKRIYRVSHHKLTR